MVKKKKQGGARKGSGAKLTGKIAKTVYINPETVVGAKVLGDTITKKKGKRNMSAGIDLAVELAMQLLSSKAAIEEYKFHQKAVVIKESEVSNGR